MSRAFKPDSTRMKFVLKGFKISDMDQVILALIFDFGLKKKWTLSLVLSLSEYNWPSLNINFFCFFFMNYYY